MRSLDFRENVILLLIEDYEAKLISYVCYNFIFVKNDLFLHLIIAVITYLLQKITLRKDVREMG